MKVIVKGYSIVGDADEILELLDKLRDNREVHAKPSLKLPRLIPQSPIENKDVEPLQNIVRESQELRKRINDDPSYNPHPGVVASKEPLAQQYEDRDYLEEADTGVEYVD